MEDGRMTYENFERRFVARMTGRGAAWVTEGGDKSYGKQTARAVWEADQDDDRENPEDAADTDMSYWESP